VLDADEDLGMISDVAQKAEDARRMVLNGAASCGWVFDMNLKRWLCPDCVAARDRMEAGDGKK
jgi:hypothetical protein